MRRGSVTITDELKKALESYRRDQDIPSRLVLDVVQAALKEYLAGRGYLLPSSSDRPRRKPKGVPRDQAVRIEDRTTSGRR